MRLLKLKTKTSVEDYLEDEKISPVRREFVEGEIYAMAGASCNHARITGNLFVALSNHLRDSICEPFFTDIKVRVTKNVYYYPDIFVSCEENPENSYLRNAPILIVEVTSPSTEAIDRREKLLFYQQVTSVQEDVIVSKAKIAVEVHRRQSDGRWITYYFDASDEEVELQSVGLTVTLADIYRRVRFDK
jgi:Uma2 family endonuclease